MSEKNKLQISIGAVAILDSIIGLNQWYKDDPKQGLLLCRAVSARDALPEIPPSLKPNDNESQRDFNKRVSEWSKPKLEVEWDNKQRDAVKVCVKFFLKQGGLAATESVVELLKLLSLDEE